MKELSKNGVNVGIAIAPIIPSYNESDIPVLLEKARDCGATEAFMTILRLPTESLRKFFVSRLEANSPTKADKILNQIRRERDGALNNSEFGNRMRGKTEQWKMTEKLFDLHYRRLNFGREKPKTSKEKSQIPAQQSLFDII